jgi:hypothetical protein
VKKLINIIVLVLMLYQNVFAIPDYTDSSRFISRPEDLLLWILGVGMLCFMATAVYSWVKYMLNHENKHLVWFKVGSIGLIVTYLTHGLIKYTMNVNLKMLVLLILIAPILSGLYSIIKANMINDQKYSLRGLKRIFVGGIGIALWALIIGVHAVSVFLDSYLK